MSNENMIKTVTEFGFGNPGNITVLMQIMSMTDFETIKQSFSGFKKKYPDENEKSWVWIVHKKCEKDLAKTFISIMDLASFDSYNNK